MHKELILKNGSRVVLVPNKDAKSMTVMKMYHVGSRQEEDSISGLAHFIEHMMFKGTEKRKTSIDITKELDGIGAQYNAFTSKDITGYYVKASAEKIETAFDILSDMLYNSTFDANELEKEKGVIVEEMKLYEDNPMRYISDIYEELLYQGNSLSRFIIGNRETINGMDRGRMVNFKEKYYNDANGLLCVAGFVPDNIEELLNKYFIQELKHEITGHTFAAHQWNHGQPRIRIFDKKVEQSHLHLGFACEGFANDEAEAYDLICTILGGGMSSRLFDEVREKRGLCYYIRMFPDLYHDAGSLLIKAGLNQEKLPEAIEVILAEVAKIKAGDFTAEELQRAKDFLIGNFVLDMEDSANVAQFYLREQAVTGKLILPEEKIEKLKSLNKEELIKVANKVFVTERINLAVIADNLDEKLIKLLLKI